MRERVARGIELADVLTQQLFGALPSGAIDEQRANQECLRDENRRGCGHPPFVTVPQARFPKLNDAARWQATVADRPSAQLARIEYRGAGPLQWCRDARGRFTIQNAERDGSGDLPELGRRPQPPPDDPVTEQGGLGPEQRRIRHGVNVREDSVLEVGAAGV